MWRSTPNCTGDSRCFNSKLSDLRVENGQMSCVATLVHLHVLSLRINVLHCKNHRHVYVVTATGVQTWNSDVVGSIFHRVSLQRSVHRRWCRTGGTSDALDVDAADVPAVTTSEALSYVRWRDKLRNVGMELLKRVVYCSYESLSSECSVFCFIFIYSSFS